MVLKDGFLCCLYSNCSKLVSCCIKHFYKLKCTYDIIQNIMYTNIGGGGGRTFIVLTFLYIVFAAFLFIVLQYIFQV